MRPRTPFQRIDVQHAENLLLRGDLVVLDARNVGSFEKSHVTGAQHVSSHNLSALLGATARTRPILIYCYHGNASREYAQIFSDFGFSEVYSLDADMKPGAPSRRRAIAWYSTPNCSNGWSHSNLLQPTSTPSSPTPRHR